MSSNFFGLITRPERLVFSLSAGVLALTGVLGVLAIGVGATVQYLLTLVNYKQKHTIFNLDWAVGTLLDYTQKS